MPLFLVIWGVRDTNGNYREYYQNSHLEAVSPVAVTIFTVFRCSTSVLITVSYHTQYMADELKAEHIFYTECRYNNNIKYKYLYIIAHLQQKLYNNCFKGW